MLTEWTDYEIQVMIDEYPDCDRAIDLAFKLNRSIVAIYAAAYKLGLRRKKNLGRLKESNVETQFKKGHIPWNKGIKGLQIGGVNTRFKKGHIPHNTKWDGAERVDVDGYVLIRIMPGKYVLKHRLIYEKHNGPIPEGMIVKFKDGNKNNMEIDNLYLSTKAENVTANSIHRYPDELKTAMKRLSKLKKLTDEKS